MEASSGERLTSTALPAIGAGDHVRGSGEPLIVYLDLGCPDCAACWLDLRGVEGLELCLRHFPIASKHPRAPALHSAAEAAGLRGAFFAMVDLICEDHGRQDDPHLWARAATLGLELGRFEFDRRSEQAKARVRADFAAGIRGGIAAVPAALGAGELVYDELVLACAERLGAQARAAGRSAGPR